MDDEIKPLLLGPGRFGLPIMKFLGFRGTEEPGFIRLRFQTTREGLAGPETVTISIPVSTMDAAGMLDGLQKLLGEGLIPLVHKGSGQDHPS